LRRVIFAFAAWSVSIRVGFCFSFEAFWWLVIAGIIGWTGVAMVEALCTGWMFVGPIFVSSSGITDNS
jgi:hypothetical protein